MNQPIVRPNNRDFFELHIVLTAPPQNPGAEYEPQEIENRVHWALFSEFRNEPLDIDSTHLFGYGSGDPS